MILIGVCDSLTVSVSSESDWVTGWLWVWLLVWPWLWVWLTDWMMKKKSKTESDRLIVIIVIWVSRDWLTTALWFVVTHYVLKNKKAATRPDSRPESWWWWMLNWYMPTGLWADYFHFCQFVRLFFEVSYRYTLTLPVPMSAKLIFKLKLVKVKPHKLFSSSWYS